jgi:hypothetical protein
MILDAIFDLSRQFWLGAIDSSCEYFAKVSSILCCELMIEYNFKVSSASASSVSLCSFIDFI